MTTDLPPDILLFNILPRLPVKSIRRFLCVSRQWQSFLTTPVFAKLQLHHVTNDDHQNHLKLLLLSYTTPCNFCTIDCETPKDGLTVSRPLPFEDGSRMYISILASLHGLICIKRRRFINEVEDTDLILWNPLTSDYKTLSTPSSDKQCFNIKYRGRFGLYYTSSDDDYKLLCVTKYPKVYIYSLKSDSWRKVESPKRTSKRIYFLMPSVLLNEKLYFLKEKQICGEHPSYLIMSFCTKTEKLSEIATPLFRQQRTERWGIGKERTVCKDFMVLRGSIHFCVAFTDSLGEYSTIELWRMNADGDWTKMIAYSPLERVFRYEKPLHIMRNGDWLMYREGHVYQRDMKKHTNDIMCRFKDMEINQRWKYMETLVSPNQYMTK
ncbi:unnamed protein product [Lactuca virosa]|uniref:F-box domain-containing protein n=1 Tax=Lactuca virosa TaxID=75947 RepID=A0AAU9PR30_9ASTR|nr:unnamed protein product [Lactuca virosa]